jgi:hypothetical protein
MISQNSESKTFELLMCVRDMQGNRTDKKKSFESDSAYKVWEFYEKNDVRRRAKNKTEDKKEN